MNPSASGWNSTHRRNTVGAVVAVAAEADFGWQLLMLVFATPRQLSSAAQSACVVQIFRQAFPSPDRLLQMSPDEHSALLPGMLHPPPLSPPHPIAQISTRAERAQSHRIASTPENSR
jgi:hypothetical protein